MTVGSELSADSSAGLAFGSGHLCRAIAVEEIVRVEGFAVAAVVREFFDGPIPILDHRNRRVVGGQEDARIAASEAASTEAKATRVIRAGAVLVARAEPAR